MTDIPEDVMVAFKKWFCEAEGFGLRCERFEGDVKWLTAAFEAGVLAERDKRTWRYDPLRPDPSRDLWRTSFGPAMSDSERSEMLARGQTVTALSSELLKRTWEATSNK